MKFQDIGIIISKKAFKENAYIILVLTKNHGLYSGILNNISKKSRSIYMEGNLVEFFWQARLVDHLGMAKCELVKSYSGLLITNKLKLYAFNSIVNIIKYSFHEREPHNNFFPLFEKYLNKMQGQFNFRDYIHLELDILTETGYGMSLDSCAVTGGVDNLCYVSPKTGRAVCYEVGKNYEDKLLKFPKFLFNNNEEMTSIAIKQSFDLTSYFFNRYFFYNAYEPKERKLFREFLISRG